MDEEQGKIMMTHDEDEEDDDHEQHCNDPMGDAVS